MLSTFLILFIISLDLFSCAQKDQVVGVVEGYYWSESDQVNGQWGCYSFQQRQELLTLLANYGIGFYWFVPQLVDLMQIWSNDELNSWKAISEQAKDLGIQVIYGIRPTYLLNNNESLYLPKLQQVQSVGIAYYSLNFDDVPGIVNSQEEDGLVSLAANLQQSLPDMILSIFVPSAYSESMFNSSQQWIGNLTIVDQINSSISMAFTGHHIDPTYMSPDQFPTLNSNRRKIFWDNWIAVDTNTRIPWGLIQNANASLFSPQLNYGYVLNLAFPLERVIHQINCLGQLISGQTQCSIDLAASVWAT